MCTHHNGQRVFGFLVTVILSLSLLSGGLLFSAHGKTASAADTVFYDFVSQAASASWSSGAGSLPFPGSDTDSRGFALYRDDCHLEDDSTWARVLETHPQWVSDGWIMGVYPEMTVASGAELKITVGFFKGAAESDGVTFEVKFEEFLGLNVAPKIHSILSHKATYDGELDSMTTDLESVEGKTGNFVLYANAGQDSGQDWAAWAEAKIEVEADTTPPIVTIGHSPSEVTTADIVTFTAQAEDDSSVLNMLIFVDGQQVKACAPPSQKTDGQGGTYWECVYTGGPYDEGTLTYQAEALDSYQNRGVSSEGSVDVTVSITPVQPPLTACLFSISGTIHDFWHDSATLKIEICEAETIIAQIGGKTVPVTTCKEGGRVWRVDTNRLFSGDLPGPDLTYRAGRLCPGTYIVTPVYQPGVDLCEWQGSWQTAKGQVVRIEDANAEGFDFAFEPEDSSAPRISSITAEPEHPELGEDVVITILTQDDGEISAIWEKTDTVFVDGSFHAGHWHSLTVSPGMLGSTAGAQFSLTDDRIMQATVRARVCDSGGNSHMAQMTVQFGSCDDGIQNQGETGVDCGGPCPSECKNCLNDATIGDGTSAYLYSPDQIEYVRGWALGAVSEYADVMGIDPFELDTSDEYIEAIAWWVPTHMGYRGDDINRQVLCDVMDLDFDICDCELCDFWQPAYYILNYSGRAQSTDPSKWFFGDCDDFAILSSALLRSLGVSHKCIFIATQPGHAFNIVNYHSKHRILEPQNSAIGCEDYVPELILNDKIDWVSPWQYTMNYPGCENPTVSVTGGGFGAKMLWLDWSGWGEYPALAVGDFDSDGRDDIAAVYNDWDTRDFVAVVFPSTGSGFQAPSAALPEPYPSHPGVMVGNRPEGDFIVITEHGYSGGFREAIGTMAACPSSIVGHEPTSETDVICFGDPRGSGTDTVIEFSRGDTHKVRVCHTVWNDAFCPRDELPLVGDFDGDGYDDAVSFARGSAAGVRVIRAVEGQSEFTMLCLWHPKFCMGDEIPGVGDFNGDGRDDVVAFNLGNGDVFVGLSTVLGFWSDGFGETQSRWHDDFCSNDDTPVVGDFNGDGLDDVACFRINSGRVRAWVALTMPSTLTYDYHGGNPCQQANLYLDAYLPSICP
ncbi:MAG: FG-GAP repeat domain-containing protein [Dehalococcoidia bacterium]